MNRRTRKRLPSKLVEMRGPGPERAALGGAGGHARSCAASGGSVEVAEQLAEVHAGRGVESYTVAHGTALIDRVERYQPDVSVFTTTDCSE